MLLNMKELRHSPASVTIGVLGAELRTLSAFRWFALRYSTLALRNWPQAVWGEDTEGDKDDGKGE